MYYFMYIYFTRYINVIFTFVFSKKNFENRVSVIQNPIKGAFLVSDNRKSQKCYYYNP